MKIIQWIVAFILSGSTLLAGGFTLYSNDLSGQLSKTEEASSFGCDGANISPELHWSNAPKGTKSFAVTVYDPDAPTGSGWWHWVVFNIPSSINALPTDFGNVNKPATIVAIQSITDYGKTGFGGACPPKGDKAHRYIFTVHALSVDTLDLDEKASPALVGFMLNANTIAKATLVSYYQR
ncbi:YbhB/YbcL family Raf kinase inhibitor-like protein [Sulfurospirillum diekertiae]|uniref:Lipoprotein LppC n=1 Tax=Sulfurospirillum diekertiae TaxID=1854492 RepID=A0A1Y0HQI0_9BACT|nr:YbhB/YbcL family Raf kinase inhibitor-like protein [Sulfurospirillum diekertiae]ARU49604.1 Putative lipoprotein LppC [Sulfurospirillum diekertiae]ASC94406.1 Putative lipoprotein LppC [Sulfurospirillum diekertiae]